MKTSEVQSYLLGERYYPLSYFTEEVGELLTGILNRDMENVLEESQDVLYAVQMILHQRTGLDFPLVLVSGHVEKFFSRMRVWEQLFNMKNVPFSTDYMRGGNNCRKPSKIKKAFAVAGIHLSQEDLRGMEGLVPGGYEV